MEDRPDPDRIQTVTDFIREIDTLRRLAAGTGEVRMPMRRISRLAGIPASTLGPYLQGERHCPQDAYRRILHALGVAIDGQEPWLRAWHRLAGAQPPTARSLRARPQPASHTETFLYDLVPSVPDARVGIVTGCICRVKHASIWVNSENTHMEMARHHEHSISAVIRHEGALRDDHGNIIRDEIADDLNRKVASRRPVAPATVIVTGPGQLSASHGVRHIIHVAAVQGEPGQGYRQVFDIGRCVTNALAEAERLGAADPRVDTVLFPLLGAGNGGAEVEPTARALTGAAIDHLRTRRDAHIDTVLFLAYTEDEVTTCRAVFTAAPRLAIAGDREPEAELAHRGPRRTAIPPAG